MSSELQLIQSISQISLSNHGIIEASAGTGKTYTLSRIYLRILFEKSISPESITVITFTEIAANELKETILNLLEQIHDELILGKFEQLSSFTTLKEISKKDYFRVYEKMSIASIQTIHSFCLSHLKENFFDWKFSLDHDVVSFEDQTQYLLQKSIEKAFQEDLTLLKTWFHIQRINNKSKQKDIKNILKLSSLQRELSNFVERNTLSNDFLQHSFNININKTLSEDAKIYYKLLSKICKSVLTIFFQQLKEYKEIHKVYSYSDMTLYLEEKLLDRELAISQILIEKTKYILFDEFQDTDFSQWNVIQQLLERSTQKHIIFTIGDPKQLIYEFRGISIDRYITSTNFLNQLQAHKYSLSTNYRSSPNMILGLNQFFQQLKNQQKIWFQNLDFQPVQYSQDNVGTIFTKKKEKTPIQIIAKSITSEKEIITISEDEYFEYCIDEIKRLVQFGTLQKNNELRPIQYHDIACLVRTNTEREKILNLLKKHDIKVSSQDNISTLEVSVLQLFRNIFYFLHAPNEYKFQLLMLSSELFSIPFQELKYHLDKYQILLMEHPTSHWKLLAQEERWQELLYSLIQESHISLLQTKNSILFQEIELVVSQLIVSTKIKAHSTIQICHLLDSWILQEETSKIKNQTIGSFYDMEQHSHEDQENTVRLLTMHKSKGLEFNIVFILGGFFKKPSKDLLLMNEESEKQHLEFYNPTFKRKQDLESEQNLIYVALTRAKYLLYLPYYTKKNKDLSISATTGILGNKLYETLYEFLHSPNGLPKEYEIFYSESFIPKTNKSSQKESFKESPDNNLLRQKDNKSHTKQVKEFEKMYTHIFKHHQNTRFIHSFSSLHSSITSKIDIEETLKEPLDKTFSIENNLDTTIEFLLEPGLTTGNFLHILLEVIEFSDFHENLDSIQKLLTSKYQDSLKSIEERFSLRFLNETNLKKTYSMKELEKKRLQALSTIIQNVLQKKIQTLNDRFSLNQIDSSHLIKELNFFTSIYEDSNKIKKNFTKIPELQSLHPTQEKYLTGSIDLVFEHNNKYYIVDYKSNYLPNYSPEFLQEHVDKTYKLQIEIYTSIFHQWLQENVSNYSYKKHFGGSFFLYLRGMQYLNNKQDGICFLEPKKLFYLV